MSEQRERLIEKAAKAIDPGAWHGGVALDPRWAGEAEHRRIAARRQATDALAMFEEANTPTNDEDRAFAWAEYRKEYEPNPAHFGREHVAFFAGWDAREGFHRTVQGEPRILPDGEEYGEYEPEELDESGYEWPVKVEPPDGWFPFGAHAPYPWIGHLEFSDEVGEDFLPLWERPVRGELQISVSTDKLSETDERSGK